MANVKGALNLRSSSSSSSSQTMAKPSFLPPRSPFPTTQPPYIDHGLVGSRGSSKTWDGNRHHQRTSSENFLIEEQPSWLDELLNEPETPVKRTAHRRSSSDSFTYFDGGSIYSNFDGLPGATLPSWGVQEFDRISDVQHRSYYPHAVPLNRAQIRGREFMPNVRNYQPAINGLSAKDKALHQGSLRGSDAVTSDVAALKNQDESFLDPKLGSEREGLHVVRHSQQAEVDTKRAKQQYAQRSRVRKLQYIAELERKVQALQGEGMEVTAEMEFLSQQNIMLDLENQALKQRLENLSQEQLIKRFQQEMFEREIARLTILQQQQQQQSQQQQSPAAPSHGRSSSRDLDVQFLNLSLKHKDPNVAGRDPISGALRI